MYGSFPDSMMSVSISSILVDGGLHSFIKKWNDLISAFSNYILYAFQFFLGLSVISFHCYNLKIGKDSQTSAKFCGITVLHKNQK